MVKQFCSITISLFFMLFSMGLVGCSSSHEVEVKPVEIKPIHITIDINVKVDRALDDFFGDIDAAEDKITKGEEE